jgi:hypothetical protein
VLGEGLVDEAEGVGKLLAGQRDDHPVLHVTREVGPALTPAVDDENTGRCTGYGGRRG